jgi:hypothetical protein
LAWSNNICQAVTANDRHRRGFNESQLARLEGDHAGSGHSAFGIGLGKARVGDAEHLVARFEIRHARADFVNDTRQIRTERERQRLIGLACTGANPRIPRPDA